MAIPSREKTFGLENCRDLLEKLKWEQERLADTPPNDVEGSIYRAFNAAVTAWHIGDWVWKDMTTDQRMSLQAEWGEKLDTKGAFQYALRKRNSALNVFREIATASKHVEVTRSPDPTIKTAVSATSTDVVGAGEPVTVIGDDVTAPVWVLKVIIGGQARPFSDVLEDAISYWTEFIYRRGVAQ